MLSRLTCEVSVYTGCKMNKNNFTPRNSCREPDSRWRCQSGAGSGDDCQWWGCGTHLNAILSLLAGSPGNRVPLWSQQKFFNSLWAVSYERSYETMCINGWVVIMALYSDTREVGIRFCSLSGNAQHSCMLYCIELFIKFMHELVFLHKYSASDNSWTYGKIMQRQTYSNPSMTFPWS